jgi:hypothetical protein
MWKPEHRLAADRRGLRYPSDLIDAEWGIVAPYDPAGNSSNFESSGILLYYGSNATSLKITSKPPVTSIAFSRARSRARCPTTVYVARIALSTRSLGW